ncbi:MAG: hypothetical protein KME13_25850 [Myxacorys californica WJT36-NPBG1]|jgi:hypothetical protein|nr:hypothetical protein [Myxacorys californica WJT36-NPBG1]
MQLLRYEYGHNIHTSVPNVLLETLVCYWFYNSVSLGNALVLFPTFVSFWTPVNGSDELLTDTGAGHQRSLEFDRS